MKIQIKRIIIALALAGSTGLMFAQDNGNPPTLPQHPPRHAGGPGGPGERSRPGGPPIVAVLDVNRDGIIDATELANAPAALKALDKNGDGQITLDEMAPPRPPGGMHRPPPPPNAPGAAQGQTQSLNAEDNGGNQNSSSEPLPPAPPHHRVPPLFAALDVNHDGAIDASEIANASVALKALDKNGDGQLTPDEYRPAPPARPDASQGQSGPGPGNRPPHHRGSQPPPSDN